MYVRISKNLHFVAIISENVYTDFRICVYIDGNIDKHFRNSVTYKVLSAISFSRENFVLGEEYILPEIELNNTHYYKFNIEEQYKEYVRSILIGADWKLVLINLKKELYNAS